MSIADQAETTAIRAADSSLLEALTRAGFLGYGLTHLLVAWLALRIATGEPAPEGDQSGAFMTLVREPGGRILVTAVCVGLAAMALWQALEAGVGHRAERGTARTRERLASAWRVLVYGYFSWTAAKVVAGAPESSADKQQAASASLMDSPGGRWLVALAGVAVLAVGVVLVGYGLTRHFEKHLHTGQMDRGTRRVARWLGIVGYLAKGVAYGTAGVLIVVAAATYDADKARGLDAAVRALAAQRYGGALLALVGLGVAAFAAFCLMQARYRKI